MRCVIFSSHSCSLLGWCRSNSQWKYCSQFSCIWCVLFLEVKQIKGLPRTWNLILRKFHMRILKVFKDNSVLLQMPLSLLAELKSRWHEMQQNYVVDWCRSQPAVKITIHTISTSPIYFISAAKLALTLFILDCSAQTVQSHDAEGSCASPA